MIRKDIIKQPGALMAISSINILGSSIKEPDNKDSNNMTQEKICTACGTAFPTNSNIPQLCPTCNDDRQFIPEKGQTWTSLNELSNNYAVLIKKFIPTCKN